MTDPGRDKRKAAATAATLAWLEGIEHTRGYPALVAAVEDAIRSGMAQGEADALALAADRQGKAGFAVIRAFRAAYARLEGSRDVHRRARDAVKRMTDGAAADTGRALADLGDDASEQDMAGAADEALGGDGSATRWTDWALWAAIGAGAMALYDAAEVVGVNWVTASDNRVCVICQDNEDGSPYTLGNAPQMPAHPRCRCTWDTTGSIASSFLAAYLS